MTTSAQALEEIEAMEAKWRALADAGSDSKILAEVAKSMPHDLDRALTLAREGWAEVDRLTGEVDEYQKRHFTNLARAAIDAARNRAEAAERENERLRKVLKEIDRLSLVISSAVNYADPKHVEIVCAALREARAALGDQT